MDINILPSLDDYWQRDTALRYAPIADRISRDRFRDISRYLHFVDNGTLEPRGSPSHDRIGKIRPLLTYIDYLVHPTIQPQPRGHCGRGYDQVSRTVSLKQYMPLKPVKRGYWVTAIMATFASYRCTLVRSTV